MIKNVVESLFEQPEESKEAKEGRSCEPQDVQPPTEPVIKSCMMTANQKKKKKRQNKNKNQIKQRAE